MDARQDGQSSLGRLRASDPRALHSHESEDGAEETQTHGGDHQTPTHLDVGFRTEERAVNQGLQTVWIDTCDIKQQKKENLVIQIINNQTR